MNKPMNMRMKRSFKSLRNQQAGMSLIEVMVAIFIMLVVAVNVMAMAITAITTTENQGHLAARTAEYAQDKMEQLLSLTFCDGTSDAAQFPAPPVGGAGLAGCPAAAQGASGPGAGGSANPAAPVAQYVDYLDRNGNLLPSAGGAPANWFYIRVWAITSLPGVVNPATGITNLKQISVTAQVRFGIGQSGLLPQSTVTAIKAFPF